MLDSLCLFVTDRQNYAVSLNLSCLDTILLSAEVSATVVTCAVCCAGGPGVLSPVLLFKADAVAQ